MNRTSEKITLSFPPFSVSWLTLPCSLLTLFSSLVKHSPLIQPHKKPSQHLGTQPKVMVQVACPHTCDVIWRAGGGPLSCSAVRWSHGPGQPHHPLGQGCTSLGQLVMPGHGIQRCREKREATGEED